MNPIRSHKLLEEYIVHRRFKEAIGLSIMGSFIKYVIHFLRFLTLLLHHSFMNRPYERVYLDIFTFSEFSLNWQRTNLKSLWEPNGIKNIYLIICSFSKIVSGLSSVIPNSSAKFFAIFIESYVVQKAGEAKVPDIKIIL